MHNYAAVFTLHPETVTRVALLRSVRGGTKQSSLSGLERTTMGFFWFVTQQQLLQIITYDYDDKAAVWDQWEPRPGGEGATESGRNFQSKSHYYRGLSLRFCDF